jgi:hypothetical protein
MVLAVSHRRKATTGPSVRACLRACVRACVRACLAAAKCEERSANPPCVTSAPGLGSPLRHICTRTGFAPASHLHQDWVRRCDVLRCRPKLRALQVLQPLGC